MAGKPASQRSTRGGSVAVAAYTPTAGRWRIDASGSTLQIGAKVGFVAAVTGRFTEVAGQLDLADNLEDSEILVEVPTASLTSGSSHWDSVLLNAGLIDSSANPTISFESTGLTAGAAGWQLSGVLVTESGCLPVRFDLHCLGESAQRIRFRATGSINSRDAVRLLSRPGLEKLIGRSMSVDLVVEAVRVSP